MFDCEARTIPISCRGALLIATRWLKFSAVGVAGVAVQLSALSLFARAGINYVLATTLAVELALLHNFAWHEVWTWHGAGLENLDLQRILGSPVAGFQLAAISVTAVLNFAMANSGSFAVVTEAPSLFFAIKIFHLIATRASIPTSRLTVAYPGCKLKSPVGT